MSELELAVNRWRGSANRWSRYIGLACGSSVGAMDLMREDAESLADAYIAHLDQQQAETRERELPVDAEWLRQIGFTDNDGEHRYLWHNDRVNGKYDVQAWLDSGKIKLADEYRRFTVGRMSTTTRGMMLDLLSSLKIPTKEQP